MEDFVARSLLFDFYGELLTEHQRKIYASIIFEDLSVSEVAREQGISRQGVHDLMKRCTRVLEEYEERLHLVERFLHIRERVHEIRRLTKRDAADTASDVQYQEMTGGVQEELLRKNLSEIDRIAESILEEL